MISILRGSEAEEKVEQYINFLLKSSVYLSIYLFKNLSPDLNDNNNNNNKNNGDTNCNKKSLSSFLKIGLW